MSVQGTIFGVSRTQQTVLVGAAGLALLGYGLLGSSAVDPSYDPLSVGLGLVIVVYAAVVAVHDLVLG